MSMPSKNYNAVERKWHPIDAMERQYRVAYVINMNNHMKGKDK